MNAKPAGDPLFAMIRACELRSRVIANNIANYETPGFVRQTVRFEDLVAEAAKKGVDDYSEITPIVEQDLVTPGRADGNNVNLELEMSGARMNRLKSELLQSLLQARFGFLKASIEQSR